MKSFAETMMGDTVNESGNTQPRPGGSEQKNPGGPGAIPAVAGPNSGSVVQKGGATNNGGRLPAVTKRSTTL